MEKPNILNDNSTTIHMHADPATAIKKLLEENQELKADKKQLQTDKQMLVESINLYKEKLQLLEAAKSSNQPQTGSGGSQSSELEKLRRELAQAQNELTVLNADIENFKSWTKKLDWSTTSRPSWLTKYFKLEEKHDVKGTFTNGTTSTMSGETVDGIWHGMCQTVNDTDKSVFKGNKMNGLEHGVRKNEMKDSSPGNEEDIYWMGKNLNRTMRLLNDGSSIYICADGDHNGVSVAVKEKEHHLATIYGLKNGYSIMLHNYKEEIYVYKFQNSTIVSTKWYQLKK